MRHCVWVLTFVVATYAAICPVAADDTAAEDVAAIQKAIASYVDAFNRADAKALAGHWAEQGEFVMPDGKTLRGRQQLEAEFTAEFANPEKAQLELVGTAVEMISPSVAVETGVARVSVAEQEPRETEYKAVHIKTAEGWKIDSVREATSAAPPPSHYDQLQALEWMIGTWSDVDESGSVETTCRWTKNRNFISRSFKVRIGTEVDFEGVQVIGWDPLNQTVRSWMFDSDGGFAVGRWTGEGERWTVQTLQVLPDGRRATATSIYELVSDGAVRFRTIGRQVDGELLPNIGPVEIVRTSEQ